MWGFRAEPAAVAEAIRLVVIAAVGFGLLKWTPEQQAMLLAVVSVILTMFVRQNVTSQVTLEQAGTTQAQVHDVAANPTAVLTVSRLP